MKASIEVYRSVLVLVTLTDFQGHKTSKLIKKTFPVLNVWVN